MATLGFDVRLGEAEVLGVELADLQLDDHEAALRVVVEKHVGGDGAGSLAGPRSLVHLL